MNNFKHIYRILSYLEAAMDAEEGADMNRISAEALGITENRWVRLMGMLSGDNLIDGFSVRRTLDGDFSVTMNDPQITLKGLEYLAYSSTMDKAARELLEEAMGA